MQILEDPTLLFRKRKGTTNKGSDYENLIIAELILSFINDDKVKDFKVWSNDDNFGLFDDIVIEIEFVNGKIDKYAMQVKYSNDARILTKNSLTEQKGNFSIEKYHADFKKSKISDYKILLYTNRKFDISEGLEIDRNIKTSNFNLIIQQVENSTLNSGRCFKLASEPPDAFFDNFFLLTNQTDVDGIRKNIEDYFHQKFNCHDYSFKKFIDFVTEWSNLEGKMVKLCKRLVQTKITLILLSELYHPLIINGSNITPHMNLLRNIIMNCHTISFVKCTENVLVTLWSDLESESAKPLLTKLSRLYHISIDNNISILLWLMGNCPLIVTQNPVLVKAINLCPDLNFVILDDSEGTKVSNLDARLLADVVTTFRCSLQGKCDISLENVFREAKLIEHIATDDLIKMVDSVWHIEELEILPFPYISRSLSRHLFDSEVLDGINFGLSGEAFVIITSYKRCTWMKYQTMNSDSFYEVEEENWEFCNGKVIFVTDKEYTKEQFDEICNLNKGKREYHHFRLNGQYLEWIRSKGGIRKYKKFLRTGYVSELDLMHCQDDNKIDIVCAGPGMGKTTLMKSIKNNTSPTCWTILVDTRNHCGYFTNKTIFIERILSEMDTSVRKIVEILLKQKRVQYIWDGLDEVSSQNLSNILDLIEELSQTSAKQWITSRNNVEQLLETRFNVLSRRLIRFNHDDQKRYIEQRLQCSEVDLGGIFQKIKTNIHLLPTNDILGTPLLIYLLTELFHKDRAIYKTKTEKIFSVVDLYEHFVDEKFNIYCMEKENIVCGNDLVTERNAAFKRQQIELYERVAVKNFAFVGINTVFLNGDRIGIMEVKENNRVEFIHRSFAEYFAACFLVKNRDAVVTLPDFLCNDKYNNVRFFFDLLLAKNCPAHVAVLYKNVDLLLKCTKDEVARKDQAGRNVLHVLCTWGEKFESINVQKTPNGYQIDEYSFAATDIPWCDQALNTVCEVCDSTTPDNLYKFTALDYAYESRRLGLYIKLLRHEVQFEDYDDVERICCVICHCVIMDFVKVFFIIKNIPHISISSCGSLGNLAADNNSLNCLKYLADKCYDDIPEWTLILCALGYCDSVKYFINNYSHINVANVVLIAIETQQVDILRFLINEKNVDVDLYDDFWYGGTLLYISSKLGLTKSVQCLIDNKADVNARNSIGRTPLHVAITPEIVTLLLDNNADVNLTDNFNNTPLHIAVSRRDDVASSLLRCQSNLQEMRGRSPTYSPCPINSIEIVMILIQNGANVNHVNDNGNLPIHSACRSRNNSIFGFLIAKGADINAANNLGEKPIHLSCEEGCLDMVHLLVRQGSNINSVTTYDETPLDMSKSDQIIQFLKSNGAISNKNCK